jgi:hypothetical protein
VLVGAAAIMLIGSVTPWATVLGGLVSAAGTVGDGIITLVASLAVAAAGVPIALKRGRLWAPIIALAAGLIAVLTTFIDIHNLVARPFVQVGYGLWLTTVAALVICVDAVVAMFIRRTSDT